MNAERIFICCHDSDNSLAEILDQGIISGGWLTFTEQKIKPAENRSQRIFEELMQCTHFIVLLSEAAVKSEALTEQVRIVSERGKPNEHGKITAPAVILPIKLPSLETLPYALSIYLQQLAPLTWQADTNRLIYQVREVILRPIESYHVSSDAFPVNDQPLADKPLSPSTSAVAVPLSLSVSVTVLSLSSPSPIADLELPQGRVPLESKYYSERPYRNTGMTIETACKIHIQRDSALIAIKAPRQMGKTSLMNRILDHASAQGYRKVSLSLQAVKAAVLSNIDSFLPWLCKSVTHQLRLTDELATYWDADTDSISNATNYFYEYVLPTLDKNLVIAIDELDRLFPNKECAQEFLPMLRSWHDRDDEDWRKLHLVLGFSTESYSQLDLTQSPFQNVGLQLRLPPFGQAEVVALAQRHELMLDDQLTSLLALVNGHPYLVRLILYWCKMGEQPEKLHEQALTRTSIFYDHLRRLDLICQEHPAIRWGLQKVLESTHDTEFTAELLANFSAPQGLQNILFQLESLGIIRQEGNHVALQCNLYRQYFAKFL